MNKNSSFCVGNSTIGSLSFYLTCDLHQVYIFLKYRKKFKILKEHESVNKYEIVKLLRYYFKSVEIKCFLIYYIYKLLVLLK